jgi:head-tail adaptor
MEAGSFRDRIEIQTRTMTKGAMGPTASAWATLATRWGAVVPVSIANQAFLAQRGHSDVTKAVVLRGAVTVALGETMRFLIGGIAYLPVEKPEVDGRGRFTKVLVREVNA